MKMNRQIKKALPKILFLFFIIIILIGIILNPKVSLSSAASGLSLWFNIVVPSLLPFFIISELLIGIGFVDFIGKLLQPLMMPIFNVPGEGAFPLSMSILSGYPVGSKLTSRLRSENLITKEEGDRLICFTSTSGPLFMLGAVSIGMLNDPNLAPLILLPHYLSILVLGLGFSFYNSKKRKTTTRYKINSEELKRSYLSWFKTKKSIGSLITNSIKESMDTIILIGGLVIFYSVLIEILFNFNFSQQIISFIAKITSLDIQIIKGIISGFFEITVGCKNIASTNISLISKVLIINFLIGWSGLSVHSQALSFINNTDINSRLYIISKFFHGILSTIFGYIIYTLKYKNYIQSTFLGPVFLSKQFHLFNWIYLLISSTKLALTISLYMFLFSIFIYIAFKKSLIRSS